MNQGQQDWSYHHTENAWPLVHAFLPKDKQLNETAALKQKLEIIQNVECNNHLRGGIVNVQVITDISWMVSMHKMGYKYAVVWFEGVWPASDDFNLKLLDEIDRFNAEDPNWMLAAQLQSVPYTVYPYISRSIIIINLDRWIIHRPPPFWVPADNPAPFEFNDNPHWEDSLYSLRVDPTWRMGDEMSYKFMYQENFATSWIAYSFLRGMTVWGISDTLMETITLVKPQMGSRELERGVSGEEYDRTQVSYQGNSFIENIFSPSSPIYFVNTEPSRPNYAEQLVGTNFEQYVGATAGFKLLYYAYKYGINDNTSFVWFDFDADSCAFKRDTLESWDGKDYYQWVSEWCEYNPGTNTKLLELTKERWPIVIDQFGGNREWLLFWNKIKKCKHTILQVDLIHDNKKLIDALEQKRTFLWTSNIYSYIVPKLLAKPFEMERSFMNLIDGLKSVHSDSWFSGTDVNDADLMCPANVIFSATDNTSIGLEE